MVENENVFRSIFENSIDSIILVGEGGVIKEWNRGAENMTGFSKEQIIGKPFWNVINMMLSYDRYSTEELEEMRIQYHEIIFRKEQTTVIRKIIHQKTQQERTIHSTYLPIVQSETTNICVFSHDITENIKREQELLIEKERLEALGDNHPNGCLYRAVMDIDTNELRFTYLSKPWAYVSGIPVETAINDMNVVFKLILPEDLPLLMDAVMKSAETMTILNIELRFHIENDEKARWVQLSSTPHNEGQQVVWDGYILDITERKNNELELEAYQKELEYTVNERSAELEATNEELYATNEELHATNEEFVAINEELYQKNDQLQKEIAARKEIMQKLEDSESKLRNFIGQSFEGIVIIDDEGRIIEWNPQQERITNIPREEALGKYSWDLYKLLMPEETAEELTELFRQRLYSFLQPTNNEQKQSDESEHILYINGEERNATLTSFQIAVEDKYYVGEIVHDTTERKLVDLELERYRTQLEEMVAFQTKKLTESKARLISLSDNLPGGVIYQMCGKPGEALQFTYISARFTDMFHLSIDDVMENCSLFFSIFHPDDQEKILELFASNQSGFGNAECRLCLGTDEIKWIHLRSSYHLQDNALHVWDGFLIDITDRKIAEQELEETRRRQNILIKVLQILQSVGDLSKAINIALSEIGQYAEVSRSYIFEKAADGKYISNTYEWCNEGVTPEIDNLQELTYEDLKTWFNIFDKGEYICTHDIATLAPEVYEILEPQGIKSILVLPLEANGINYGFVGFDDCTRHKEWQQKEVELLISLSQIISTSTRRFRAEKTIQLSQQTMRTVLDNINASIYVADFDTYELLFANKMVKDQMGDNIEGKPCWQVLQHGMTGPCDFCPNSKLLDSEKKPTGLYCWEFKNRTIDKWFECTDAAIKWVDGRLVHMEYATDITERRAAEEALRQSEELYRQLMVASPDAIIVCNPRGKIIFISPKAKELFLVSNETKIRKMRVAHYVHPHDANKAYELFMSLVEDKVSFLPQLLLMREDGSEFFGEISAASVKGDDGRTTSIIMVVRDITERKMSEMELIRAKEKAEESDKLKSAFLANMSHEIRTPINGIIGFLNFLADENLSPKRRQEYITVVNNSSVQLVKLIDDIIDVAKIEAKQMSLRPVIFPLNGFMTELQVFFDTYLQANNKDKTALLLDDSYFIEPCEIFVDPMRLRQVLSNLIGNAIKFTEKGYIGFGYRQLAPDKLEFWVEDSGIGLAKDQLEVIFERFRQAELTNSRKYGGTGLGLTISRSLVQMMGGDISVESLEGEGSTFRFTISYLPISPEDKPIFDENHEEKPINMMPFKGKDILIVEPETMTYRYYEKLLAYTGATMIHAQTTKQWIDAISQRKHINAVLTNARVFQNEDFDVLRQVRSVRAGLPLVLLVPEHNEYYNSVINDCQCNSVIEGTPNYATLYDALKEYV